MTVEELFAVAARYRAEGFTVDETHAHLMPGAIADGLDEAEAKETINRAFALDSSQFTGCKPLEFYQERFGPNTIFLSIIPGEKRPRNKGWQNITLEQSREPAYLEELARSSIGVKFGPDSGNLAGLDLDNDRAVSIFLAVWPAAANTLQTRGQRGRTFFFRMIGDYPSRIYKIKSADTGEPMGEWRGGGGAQTVVGGRHPSGCFYQVPVDKPIMEVKFNDIPWPVEFLLPWLKAEPAEAQYIFGGTESQDDLNRRILSYLAAIPGAISGNGGHNQTFKVALALVNRFALSPDAALPYLHVYNDERCVPPWTEKELLHKLADAAAVWGVGEIGEFGEVSCPVEGETGEISPSLAANLGEISPSLPRENGETSPNSPISPGPHAQLVQRPIFPPDSILADFYDLAVTVVEGADCYIIGSILPICAALMARAVWLPWAGGSLHCNLYAMLAGKPGDRKSSTIDLPEMLVRKLLPQEAFIPKAFSPETLIDEYDLGAGGCPDKLWICDDANATLADWQKSATGERNAARFLELYDCKHLSESYRRNRTGKKIAAQRRYIPFTSTSIVFGATFNICTFRNQTTRAGMQRRFLYYVAEGHGRKIRWPQLDQKKFDALVADFSLLQKMVGKFFLSQKALALFDDFQDENRAKMNASDPLNEPLLSRLSSSPVQTLKVAMIFEACRSAASASGSMVIQETTLQYAIDHVNGCLEAAARLDSIARRIYIANDAEVLLARIRVDFQAPQFRVKNAIVLTRTELTCKYAGHGNNRGLNVQDLYIRLLPYLISRGDAVALPKTGGKRERYAFRVEP
jgi:hypothetical protein